MTTTYTTINGEIVSMHKDGQDYFLVPDTQGNVAMVRDASGNVVYEAEYWPYGEVRTELGTNPSNLKYLGTLGYYEDRPGMAYVRNRYLREDLARWQTVDPLWPREGAYKYAENSPVLYVDPNGTQIIRKPPGLDYGNYCGPDNRKNPWPNPKPISGGIDACCQRHDRCLEAHYGGRRTQGQAHACCDGDLAACAKTVLDTNSCAKAGPGYVDCRNTAQNILDLFNVLSGQNKNPTTTPPCIDSKKWWPYILRDWRYDPRCTNPYVPPKD